jgi:hypothetical protein
MSAGPDIAGLYAALTKVNPGKRATYRAASAAHRAAGALKAGRRYRTRPLPRPLNGRRHWEDQPRDAAGRFTAA